MNVTPRTSGRSSIVHRWPGILVALFVVLPTLFLLTGCKSKTQSENVSSSSSSVDKLELVFTYGSEKEKWINEVTESFNRADHRTSSARIFVRAFPIGFDEIEGTLDGPGGFI